MKRLMVAFPLLVLCLVLLTTGVTHGAGLVRKPWRVALIEGGGYADYQRILVATTRELAKLGLIANGDAPIPTASHDSLPIWEWLAANAGGEHLVFVKDAHYSAQWNAKTRAINRELLIERIRTQGDVDMVITLGTWAGRDMVNAAVDVPIFAMAVADPVEAGIVPSVEDSGRDNVYAQVVPERYRQQLMVFHDVFGFKKLGIPYDDSREGRASVALRAIEATAAELDIELVRCTTKLYLPTEQSVANLKMCFAQLAKTSDAVFLTTNPGMQWNRMQELLEPLVTAGMPTFSQSGMEETRLGVLMSLSQNNFASEGAFGAAAIAKVVNGMRPRDVGLFVESAIGLAINLKMARLIHWDPPFEMLLAADELYQDFKFPGEE